MTPRGFSVVLAIVCGGLALTAPVHGQDDAPGAEHAGIKRPGRVVRVPVRLPIDKTVASELQKRIEGVVEQLAPNGPILPRPTIVIDFGRDESNDPTRAASSGEGSELGPCYDVANLLSDTQRMQNMETVAFVPQSLRGHSVLLALACERLVIGKSADLGDAGVDMRPVERTATLALYGDIALRRRTVPEPVARKMIDQQARLVRLVEVGGERFALGHDADELLKTGAVNESETLKREGETGVFSGGELRKWRIASHNADDLDGLAKALGIARDQFTESAALAATIDAIHIRIEGPLDGAWALRVQQLVRGELKKTPGPNFLLLSFRCPGGEPSACQSLATFLVEEIPRDRMRVAAYVMEARGAAVMPVFAADELVVDERGALGGASKRPLLPESLALLKTWWKNWSERTGKPWSLGMALMGAETIVRRHDRAIDGARRAMSEEERVEQSDADAWTVGPELNLATGLRGPAAVDVGVARAVVANLPEAERLFRLETPARLVRTNWLLSLVEQLADSRLSNLLLFIALFALFTELSTPGLGVPGFIACVCFGLYFWANFLKGTADWLEVTLFVLGVLCVCVEVFLAPGTMIFGIGGGIMIILSIVLASQTFVLPTNASEMRQLPASLFSLALAGIAAMVGAAVLHRYLPHTPYLRELILSPPSESELAERSEKERLSDHDALLGQRGVAVSPMTPAGKAKFGNETLSVSSEGDWIEAGQAIEVVQVVGGRIVVRSVG